MACVIVIKIIIVRPPAPGPAPARSGSCLYQTVLVRRIVFNHLCIHTHHSLPFAPRHVLAWCRRHACNIFDAVHAACRNAGVSKADRNGPLRAVRVSALPQRVQGGAVGLLRVKRFFRRGSGPRPAGSPVGVDGNRAPVMMLLRNHTFFF